MTSHWKTAVIALAAFAASGPTLAQFEDVSPEDRPRLERQAIGVFEALEEVVAQARPSTVEVRVWQTRVAFGTVVAPERVLTKWSDVRRSARSLLCRGIDGELHRAEVVGVYPEHDLSLLKVEGLEAPPLKFDPEAKVPPVGSFLALVRPDGEAGGMGVVSVLPRSLRDADQAYLGVWSDPGHGGDGIKVLRIEPGSAASRVGLRPGDLITAIDGTVVDGSFELGSYLQRREPGDEVAVTFVRTGEEKVLQVVLGERADDGIPKDRMEAMNRMGGHRYSAVTDDFPDILQTDMQIKPEDCGAPVVGLDGKVIGVALARAGRIKSYLLPAAAVADLLATDPKAMPRRMAMRWEKDEADAPDDTGETPDERMRRHMRDMERLLRELDRMERNR